MAIVPQQQTPTQPQTNPQAPTAPQETFLQRQARVYGQPTGTTSATSPVSSTGRIAADQTPTYTAGKVAGTTYQAGQVQAPQQGWATYQPNVQVPQAQVYNPGPLNTYQGQQIQQFQAPNQQQLDAQSQAHIQNLMANPYSMSQQQVDAMKNQQREQALLMQKQMLGQLGGQAASRGIDPSAGYGQMMQRQAMENTQAGILAGNRDIDMKKAAQDRQDLLQALQASGDWQNSQLGRAVSAFNTNLAGIGAQRGEDLAQLQSEQDAARLGMSAQQQSFADAMAQSGMEADLGYKQYQSTADAQQRAMQAGLANESLLQAGAQSALGTGNLNLGRDQLSQQMDQFLQNLGFDKEKFAYQKTLDDRQLAEAAAGRGAAASQWEDQMALEYQKMAMAEQDRLLQYLLQGGGEPDYMY